MTPEQLQAARDYFLGKSADVSVPDLQCVWECGTVDWNGVACRVMLYGNNGSYRELKLQPEFWDPATFDGWWAARVTSLQAQAVEEAELLALQALDGLEV